MHKQMKDHVGTKQPSPGRKRALSPVTEPCWAMILDVPVPEQWENWFLLLKPPVCVCWVTSVVSESLQPHGLQLARLLCQWNAPDKDTRVCCHAFLQGSSPPRAQTHVSYVSCSAGEFFTTSAAQGAPYATCSGVYCYKSQRRLIHYL